MAECRHSQKWREEAKLSVLELQLGKKGVLAVGFGHKEQRGRAGTPEHDGEEKGAKGHRGKVWWAWGS